MSPYASKQSTGKMTNRPHFAHIQTTPVASPKSPGFFAYSYVFELLYLQLELFYLLARPLCRNVSGIFAVQILEDFAGDFPGGFLGTFSHKK